MTTIYVFENFDDQPSCTWASITRPTEAECVAVFDDQFGSNDFSWSLQPISDSADAEEV